MHHYDYWMGFVTRRCLCFLFDPCICVSVCAGASYFINLVTMTWLFLPLLMVAFDFDILPTDLTPNMIRLFFILLVPYALCAFLTKVILPCRYPNSDAIMIRTEQVRGLADCTVDACTEYCCTCNCVSIVPSSRKPRGTPPGCVPSKFRDWEEEGGGQRMGFCGMGRKRASRRRQRSREGPDMQGEGLSLLPSLAPPFCATTSFALAAFSSA